MEFSREEKEVSEKSGLLKTIAPKLGFGLIASLLFVSSLPFVMGQGGCQTFIEPVGPYYGPYGGSYGPGIGIRIVPR